MAGSAYATTDHDFIRSWVERRGGHPARLAAGERVSPCIFFPDLCDEAVVELIDWDEFFVSFEHEKLAFLHQETTACGMLSYFHRLVDRAAVYAEELPAA